MQSGPVFWTTLYTWPNLAKFPAGGISAPETGDKIMWIVYKKFFLNFKRKKSKT